MKEYNYLVVTGHNTWGKGQSITEARRNARCKGVDHHLLYTMTHGDFSICEITGGVRYPHDNNPIELIEEWKDGEIKIIEQ